jgi:hypothetical protein
MSTPPATDRLEGYPLALHEAVTGAFGKWYSARITAIIADSGVVVPPGSEEDIARAAADAGAWVAHELLALLATDVDEQTTNPLHLLRGAARFATPLLDGLGVPRPVRDEFETRAMPDDVFAVGPLAWIDMGDHAHEAGIGWGAWKAATVLTRRRAEGKLG